MKRTRLTILSLTILLLTISCDEESIKVNIEGEYVGTFTVEYIDGSSFSNTVSIHLNKDNSYNSSGNGNQNDFYPAGGSGTFNLLNGEKINFSDSNIWLAHFDWHLILAGEYDYSISGDKLTIHKELSEFGLYKYELTKK
jgi:hypothetical protein